MSSSNAITINQSGYTTNDSLLANVPTQEENHQLKKPPPPSRKCLKCCTITLIIMAIGFGILSISLGASTDAINAAINDYVALKLALVPGSPTSKQLGSPTETILFSLYVFNLTNKEVFLTGGKPIFKEIGPFVYRENATKFDFSWNNDETILNYNRCTTYTFDKNLSHGLDPTMLNITTLNIGFIGILTQFIKLQNLVAEVNNTLYKQLLNDVIEGLDDAIRNQFKENLFMTLTADEFLWGYHDPLLDFVEDLDLPIPGLNLPKDGKISLINKASCASEPCMLHTGKGYYRKAASFIMWEGHTSMDGWGTPYAGMINGTQAALFHTNVQRSENLSAFVFQVYRSVQLTYIQDYEEYGLKMYQYRLPSEELSGKNSDPGFYMNGPDGVFNLSGFFPLNIPAYMSKPHFLDGPTYLEYIEGLKPEREKHDTILNVEPITGAVLKGVKRLQVNVQLTQNPNINELSRLQNITYFPLFWIDEGGQMSASDADKLKEELYGPLDLIHGSVEGVTSVSGFIAVLSIILLVIIATYHCEKYIKQKIQQRPAAIH